MHSHNKRSCPEIIYNLLPHDKRNSIPKSSDSIAFGAVPTDHMLVCDFISDQGGWQTPVIQPFAPFSMRPDALVFHYGQTIFEGMKAFKGADSEDVFIFRADKNAKRMAHSARRLAMEPFPEDWFIECTKALVAVDRAWVLPSPAALYIRPTMIALGEGVSYRQANNYRFFIILSPAKSYFTAGQSISVYIERELARVALGGCGEAKCGGNYAGALQPMAHAKSVGAEQVLWLDAAHKTYVEEAGAMNVMFVYGNDIVTPELSGSILHGVTRDSLLRIAQGAGYGVKETKVKVNDILADIEKGTLTEAFACGTAAVVSSIGCLFDRQKRYVIQDGKPGKVALDLKEKLLKIQSGQAEDKFQWLCKI